MSAVSGCEADGVVLDRAQTVRLIRQYGAHRQLWDVADARYFHRAARARAWRDIARFMRVPVPDLKKKLVSLMGSYRREKSREKQSKAAGHLPDLAYKSKWYGYEHFSFLADRTAAPLVSHSQHYEHEPDRDHNRDHEADHEQPLLDIVNTVKVEFTDYDEEEAAETEYNNEVDSPAPTSPTSPASPEAPPPRRRAAARADPLGACEAGAAGREAGLLHDEYTTFGYYIASELRKYDAVTLAHAKHAINGVIFEANMGRLPHHLSTTSTEQ